MSALPSPNEYPIEFIHKGSDALARSRAPVNQATHTPGYVYGDPAVLALEKERLFMKDWLCIGRVEELPKPGDYLTQTIVGEPIMVVRSKAGVLQAFYNQCRHRGVEVAQGQGNAKIFKCPYHAWTYDLDGKLIGVPFMKEAEGFDQKNCSLKPIRLDSWGGWIFISFNPAVESLGSYLDEYREEFALLRQEDLRLGLKYETDFDCNWKFVYENLLDIYHVGVTHADSIGRYQDQSSYRYHRLPRGRLSIHYRARTMSATGESLFGKIPWLPDDDGTFARIGFLPPNLTLLARCDYVRPMVHWPSTVDRTHSVGYFLFPEEKLADPAFDEKVQTYASFLTKVLDEDRGMILSLQRAMSSEGFEPGRMSHMEDAIHHVLGYHLERVFGVPQA
jgi:phenylpropionate dioxygenase-like ring-hydroxylating dioxygenase large terminal subunit